MEEVRDNRLSEEGKRLYKTRSQTVERSFTDAKELHGYRYYHYQKQEKIQEQPLLTASAQNIKKMALILRRDSSYSIELVFSEGISLI